MKRKRRCDMTEEHTCETCKYGERYRKGRDITTMDDECGGCCSWNDKYEPNETEVQ